MQYNIMDYGALPDGKTNNQKQIQAAIEDCAKTGGRVLVPAGNFLSGTIQLKSNVELYLEKGSVLTASNSPEDIIDFSEDRDAMDGIENGCFLYACHARNITISGEGTIDGKGRKVYLDDNADEGFHECPLAVAGFRARTTIWRMWMACRSEGLPFMTPASGLYIWPAARMSLWMESVYLIMTGARTMTESIRTAAGM